MRYSNCKRRENYFKTEKIFFSQNGFWEKSRNVKVDSEKFWKNMEKNW